METVIKNFYDNFYIIPQRYNASYAWANIWGMPIAYVRCKNNNNVLFYGASGYNSANCIQYSGNYIKFNGIGDLYLNITAPSASVNMKIKNSRGSEQTIAVVNSTTIEINPTSYQYTKNGDEYTVEVKLTNCSLSSISITDTVEDVYIFSKPSVATYSRRFDGFATSFANSYNASANVLNGTWASPSNDSERGQLYGGGYILLAPLTYSGDGTCIMESLTSGTHTQIYWSGGAYSNSIYFLSANIPNIGFNRMFYPFHRKPVPSYNAIYHENVYAKAYFVATDFTYPVNAVLFYGAEGTTVYNKSWQSKGGNLTTYSPTAGAQLATRDVCQKLKDTYGSNLRIYVVKYRKQANYKTFKLGVDYSAASPACQAPKDVAFNYTYVDDCASAPAYVYDIATEAALKTTLDAIAANIKTWAGCEDAKVVE
jgi:carbon monoxide dehydrogenase subunit G